MRHALLGMQRSIEHLNNYQARNRGDESTMEALALGINDLVNQMRTEQQTIRDWVEAQAEKQAEIKDVLEQIANDSPRQTDRNKD